MNNPKTISFRTLDGRVFKGNILNPAATLGATASRVAAKAGMAGSFETLDEKGVTLDPNMTLADLPQGAEVTLASELTPAVRRTAD